MTLYEICEELKNFQFEVDDETGEILNAMQLDELELAREDKIKNVCYVIKNYMADAEAYKAEKQKFADKEKRAKNRAESLKRYLESMLDGESWEADDKTVSAKFRKSKKVDVADVWALPDYYLRHKEPEANKTEIAKAIKAGIDVPGCALVDSWTFNVK